MDGARTVGADGSYYHFFHRVFDDGFRRRSSILLVGSASFDKAPAKEEAPGLVTNSRAGCEAVSAMTGAAADGSNGRHDPDRLHLR